jgi:hypothetical protein
VYLHAIHCEQLNSFDAASGFPSSWVNIVPCPFNTGNSQQWEWWCGTNSGSDWCNATANNPNASFFLYTHGTNLNIVDNNSTVSASNSTNNTVPASNTTAQNATVPSHAPSLFTASQLRAASAKVGLGIGIPLAILSVVLAVLLVLEKRKNHLQVVVEKTQKTEEQDGLPRTHELGQDTQPFELPSG